MANSNPHHLPERFSHIQGWGADLDHKNRPAYPKERMPARIDAPLTDPEPQHQHQTILRSNERPTMTPLFGTSSPPVGLSGLMRRAAFKLSENDIRHWLILLFADRVNMVEGILGDLAHGHIPNIFAEMGGRAELKYNKRGALKKLLVAGTIVGVGALLMSRRPKGKPTKRGHARRSRELALS